MSKYYIRKGSNGKNRRFSYSEEDELKIVQMYKDGKSGDSISKITDVSYGSVWEILKKYKVKKRTGFDFRTYRFDTNYFSVIDTERKAYFLGLLYADGNVSKDLKSISISLKEGDQYLLEEFKKELKNDKNLKLNYIKSPNSNNFYPQWSLKIHSKKMVEDLIRLGCVPAKSFILEFPTNEQIPIHLLHHFMRGYFCGDGSVYFLKKSPKDLKSNIIGSHNFCKDFVSYLSKIYKSFSFSSENRGKVSVFKMCKASTIKLFNYLYQNATIFLKRKYQQFIYGIINGKNAYFSNKNRHRDEEVINIFNSFDLERISNVGIPLLACSPEDPKFFDNILI